MHLSSDSIIFWQYGSIRLNATIVFTWLVMGLLVTGSRLLVRTLADDENRGRKPSRARTFLEILVIFLLDQIREITKREPKRFFPFLCTIFLFIATCNLLAIIPGFQPPTGSLSTTTALALCVLVAVPLYGIAESGLLNYLRNYIDPTPLMLPFNITGEFSRTLALAVRLFGNVMSGGMIGAILLAIAPLFFPVIMQLLGLLTGLVQAYIFSILAAVYIGAGIRARRKTGEKEKEKEKE